MKLSTPGGASTPRSRPADRPASCQVWAIVVAAGSGTRFGEPKQFSLLADRPVVEWAVEACRAVALRVVLVLPADRMQERFGADLIVEGGSSRSDSVRRGLGALPRGAELVVVHDAARPLASSLLFHRVLEEMGDPSLAGAVCGVPVNDTLKEVDAESGCIVATVDRSVLMAVQTPQIFRAPILRDAHARGGEATDDAGLVEALGATVRVVAGDPCNLKLTSPDDLSYAEHLLARNQRRGPEPGGGPLEHGGARGASPVAGR